MSSTSQNLPLEVQGLSIKRKLWKGGPKKKYPMINLPNEICEPLGLDGHSVVFVKAAKVNGKIGIFIQGYAQVKRDSDKDRDRD
jgi:hypothetical protein